MGAEFTMAGVYWIVRLIYLWESTVGLNPLSGKVQTTLCERSKWDLIGTKRLCVVGLCKSRGLESVVCLRFQKYRIEDGDSGFVCVESEWKVPPC